MKSKIVYALVALFGLAAVATPLAHAFANAQAAPAASDSGFDLAKQVYQAVASGDWRLAAAFALLLLVAGLRWLAPKLHDKVGDFLNGDAGGALLVLLAGYGSALTTARMAGASWSWSLARTAAEVALSAAGGYSVLKKLFAPMLAALWAKVAGK